MRTHTRIRVEERLLEEGLSIIRIAERSGSFDWAAQGFKLDDEFGIWEKTLKGAEVERLLG